MARVLSPDATLDAALLRHFPGAARASSGCAGRPVSGAELVREFLIFVGAEVIFGIPGGASLPLTDALTAGHQAGAFRYVLTGHEQGAGFEAEGYAAASGRCGFCMATSGPGATNLVTPLADALRDSRPLFALTGNAAATAEPEAFQALDIVGITNGRATKASFRPEHPDRVQDLLVRAYHTAVTGRPGSVLLDLPKDVQIGATIMRPWEELVARLDWSVPRASDEDLWALARLLAGAARPLLYAGHGISLAGATPELRELSQEHGIPVATTVHGLGLMADGDPLSLGMLGMHGSMVANLAPYLADVVVAVGARFDDRVVGAQPQQFAPAARVAHVDIEVRQLGRVRAVDLAIHSDVRVALRGVLDRLTALPRLDRAPWLAQLAQTRQAMPTQSYDAPEREVLSHEWVYMTTAAALTEAGRHDVVATFDVGNHQMKGAQWFPISRPRSWLTSGGMGSMGCALPMAVGAHFARPDATILAFCGDGGFVMASHELDTIGGYQLPLKMVVFDDGCLGMVHNWHGLYFAGRALTSDRRRGRVAVATDLAGLRRRLQRQIAQAASADDLVAALSAASAELAAGEWPLFTGMASGYGIPAERVHGKAQFAAAIERALAASGPYLIQVILPRTDGVYPLMEPGTTPQEMIWRETAPGSGLRIRAGERFDYAAGRLRPEGWAAPTNGQPVAQDAAPRQGRTERPAR